MTHSVKKPARGGTETILLVEDEPNVRALTDIALKTLGYKVIEAESGVAALEIWRAHRDQIHLVLTDIVMPGGVSGMELAKILLAENPSVRVIFTSGYSPDAMRGGFELRDGLNFLPKPYPFHELAKILRRALDQ
jgi:CheY-like chemotaxis protein